MFEIHLWINQVGHGDIITYQHNSNVPVLLDKSVALDLAKRDGFSSAEKLFQFFDRQYDLSSPKEFYVYRWKYA